MLKLFLLILIVIVISYIVQTINNKLNNSKKFKISDKSNNIYSIKSLMTKYEKYFYDIFIELEDELNIEIMPQVNLASIIDKTSNYKYRNELFRNIDFGIFTKNYDKLLLLIEINDNTHNAKKRKVIDKKVDSMINKTGIKLIKFYSNYPNKKDYVKQRIKEELNKIIREL